AEASAVAASSRTSRSVASTATRSGASTSGYLRSWSRSNVGALIPPSSQPGPGAGAQRPLLPCRRRLAVAVPARHLGQRLAARQLRSRLRLARVGVAEADRRPRLEVVWEAEQ